MGNNTVNFANELNPRQWEAVQNIHGPVLILAGAGSGKTRVLTYRAAYLVATGEASPHEILAVTFTNKAAKEMLERLGGLLNRVGVPMNHSRYENPLWVSTFHSSCVRILRSHIDYLGYDKSFAIYDDGDQLALIKKVCEDLQINDKIYPPKSFQYQINRSKNLYLSPEGFRKQNRQFFDEKVADVYARYELEMRRCNALDFGDLLYKSVELFQKNPQLLAQYQERFKFIMVDEYQDTNRVQYLLVNLLAGKYKNLCVVGDEDQSIYSWRGADITNILTFEHDFPDAKIIKLEENYRSTKNIVEAASHVIRNNSERKDKTLWTSNAAGSLIQVREEMNEQDEARAVVNEIAASARDENRTYNEFAIFYRTNAQSRVFEDQLRSRQIPYKIVGGIKFYERAEIKDILGYLKLLHNPKDDLSFRRIINTPARGIGKTTVEKLMDYATQKGLSLFEATLPALQEKFLDRGATRKVLEFYELLHNLKEQAAQLPPRDLYIAVLDATQYVNKLKAENNPEALARVENLEELDTVLSEFQKERGDEATLAAFLEEMALVTDADKLNPEQDKAVTLMTLHVSKGLEFPVVFIVGLEDGLFPSSRTIEESGNEDAEEERRLFYVGMTRARQKLFLSHARIRTVWGREQMNPPSRFLNEIPEQYVEKTSQVRRALGATTQWRQAHAKAWDNDGYSSMPSYEDFGSDFPSDADEAGSGFRKGMRVRHPSYGVGVIHKLEGQGPDQKVEILFPDKSLKKFVVKFARLERA